MSRGDSKMSFTNSVIQWVWEKGKIVPGNDPNVFRKDDCDAWIKRTEYGNRQSSYGWEIDHIKPLSKGGTNDLANLRPLQWENNASKQEDRLVCVVTSSGTQNVRK